MLFCSGLVVRPSDDAFLNLSLPPSGYNCNGVILVCVKMHRARRLNLVHLMQIIIIPTFIPDHSLN